MSLINNTLVSIDTTVPTLSIGQIQLSADRRSTKEAPLTDDQRIRRAVLPANHWGEYAATINGERNQALVDVLRVKLVEIASARLRDTLTEEPMARTIALADYTIPSLLAWSTETAASRGSITFTRDEVTAWFATSGTRNDIAIKLAADPKLSAKLAFVEKRFATLAAKNHGLSQVEEVTKLAALISPADMEGDKAALVADIFTRLEAIKKNILAKLDSDTISMDDI